ncbi:hypothetical protein LSTR_LSTR010288 [Laodelphax striatellus]|uniref:Rho-GAP domain-containing protein n=1 Tax=Laodelphax striatellus TaxID=195883 RepID=A0A482XQA7_LAOST|nr:hypothetical protein LSTR_LSTR010288 [Laodelphax striatellus]
MKLRDRKNSEMSHVWVYVDGHLTHMLVAAHLKRIADARHSRLTNRMRWLTEVQRLAQYEQYLQTFITDSSSLQQQSNEERESAAKAKAKAKQAVKRGQEESDLERIQDIFPNDDLHLYDKDVLTMRMKGLMRKRSGTAARLTRALSAKSLRPESPPTVAAPQQQSPTTAAGSRRQFVMEAPVQLTAGVQSQDRHLFLFNDLLLVAKARSGGNFKLKDKVRVSELWLAASPQALDDVAELHRSPDTSFVLGWPTTNVVATFTTQAGRDLWWSKLTQVLLAEKVKEPVSTNIQVVYYDLNTSIEYCKTFSVGPDETAKDCIRSALSHLEMRHERPFAIKLSCLRDGLSSEEGFDLDHCNNVHDPLARCHFILRSTCKPHENEVKKSAKKPGRIGISRVFRRSLSKDSTGCLFGQPLSRVCEGETLPRSVMMMLQQVLAKGPFTQGIFRKSANARLVRELREKLDQGESTLAWEHIPVLVTAALLKDFLRSLPDPLLTSALYPHWKTALDNPNPHTKLLMLKEVLQQLPKANHTLLAHFVCVLHHISRRSAQNLMSAANLGVCVGPSLLWSSSSTEAGVVEDLRAVPALVECLITNCQFLLGTHVPHLLGDPRDSGTEESDSLRRDDSSIDSLECSPPPRKDKMSLSRDSGLTMSDSQLYTPDEEESGSTSSSGYDPAFDPHSKVTPSLSVPGEYVRVYGGWEERLNPNFSRQAWFRQRSRRLSSAPNSNSKQDDAVRRSASEESLLDSAPPPTPPRRNRPEIGGGNSTLKCQLISPIRQSNDESKSKFPEDKFGRHPPLRKVTAVHCEVVDVSTPYKENALHLYSVNADPSSYATYDKNNFGSPRIPAEQIYSSPQACEQKYVRSRAAVEPQYSSPISGRVQRLTESYSSPRLHDSPRLSDQSHDSPKLSARESCEYYYSTQNDGSEEMENGGGGGECEDSSTLSDDDCTPHVSRSNSRGNEVTPKLRHLPPVHVADSATTHVVTRGRLKRKEERAAHAHRSRSLPPPPPYRPPPPASNRRAPITSYYLGDCSQSQRYVVTTSFLDEESYV